MQLSKAFWWVLLLFVSKRHAVPCANPLIATYNMVPPEDPKTRIHYGVRQIELLRGDGGRSLWIDAPGQLDEIMQSHLPSKNIRMLGPASR
jgi:hypothetical protein